MFRRASTVLVWLFLSAPDFAVPGFAQTMGTITGEVKDSSGVVIPGVNVTAENTATNATRDGAK